mmetsp:Transcript_48821/g.147108  ORF Transcript_48821/g.147108 Transcript_48821/m.147108 type:complete len:212 (-) Transcript_48821:625-1260(-)
MAAPTASAHYSIPPGGCDLLLLAAAARFPDAPSCRASAPAPTSSFVARGRRSRRPRYPIRGRRAADAAASSVADGDESRVEPLRTAGRSGSSHRRLLYGWNSFSVPSTSPSPLPPPVESSATPPPSTYRTSTPPPTPASKRARRAPIGAAQPLGEEVVDIQSKYMYRDVRGPSHHLNTATELSMSMDTYTQINSTMSKPKQNFLDIGRSHT